MSDDLEAQKQEMYQSLADHGKLILTVTVSNAEEAGEIIRWMYADVRPMKAKLEEIAWNKVAVLKDQAEALAALLKTGMRY